MNNFGRQIRGLREHVFEKIEPEELYIIVCDGEFNICEITKSASELFDVVIGDNIADFIDYEACKKISLMIEQKSEISLYDKIDNVYFKINASFYDGKAVLIFKDINDARNDEISYIAKIASEQLGEYIKLNDELIEQIKEKYSEDEYLAKIVKLEERAMLKLFSFDMKMRGLHKTNTIHLCGFETLSLSKFMQDFADEVMQTIDGCDIKTEIQEGIVCQFDENLLMIAMVNIMSDMIEQSVGEAKIALKLHADETKVHISIRNLSKKVRAIYDINSRLSQATTRNIIERHNGSIYGDGKREITLTMPMAQDEFDMFSNPVMYETKNPYRKRMVATMTLIN